MSDSLSQAKLNDESYSLLRRRREDPLYQNEFSLIFIGDSHVGQECSSGAAPEVLYLRLLERIRANERKYRNILAIFHGGDGTHRGKKHLEEFIAATRYGLDYDVSSEDRIPLFMNVGNHEYINDPELKNYNALVGNGNYIQEIWLRPQNTSVLFLNTGGPNSDGFFKDPHHFANELTAMGAIIKAHPHYRFIIDMHIPPAVGPHKGKSHALNKDYTAQFTKFLKSYLNRVALVVVHHRHCVQPSRIGYLFQGKVPIYLTAFAGHCDCLRLSALKITYSRNSQGVWKVKTSIF